MRIGHGYDTHKFQLGKRLVLGGVEIPYEYGMEAHSDGDVIIHALGDAVLGALALGDLGQHFPDNNAKYQNIDSRILLREIVLMLDKKHYQLSNADITVLAQAPKLSPYIEKMRKTLSQDLRVDIDQINIKATTTERMGFIGRQEGIAAYAVVLLGKKLSP